MVAETSSCGRKESSVNRSKSDDLPTLELPMSSSLRVGISEAAVIRKERDEWRNKRFSFSFA